MGDKVGIAGQKVVQDHAQHGVLDTDTSESVPAPERRHQRFAPLRSAGDLALIGLLLSTWLLLVLAWLGAFHLWAVALVPAGLAVGAAVWAWVRATWVDRLVVVLLVGAGCFLFAPPAEHLPLSGDSSIYPNEAAFLARNGGLEAVFTPLAELPPATRTLFYVTNEEQFDTIDLEAYQGLIYGGYYVTDAETFTVHTSRMALSTAWLALLYNLSDIGTALYATSVFATLALVLLYLVGRQCFGWPIALWVALLLAVNFAQIHFGRAPYAEISGQFWTLAGVLYALRWLKAQSPMIQPPMIQSPKIQTAWLLVMALACWVTTWAGRIDALLLLGPVGVLLLVAATNRDWRAMRAVLLALPLLLSGIWISTNGAYVGATYELLLSRWPWFGSLLLLLLAMLLMAVALMWLAGRQILALVQRVAPLLYLLLFLAFAFIILWSTIPNPLREVGVRRNFQEIIWFSSQLMTPGLYWLALAGVGWLCLRQQSKPSIQEFWLLTTTLLLAFAFFYTYTSGAVYPGSMRRLISDVVPLLTLLAGFALAAPWPGLSTLPGWHIIRGVVAVALLAWMAMLSWPIVQEREGTGTVAFVEQLHTQLPAASVLFFEHQDGDSWVGWLAAPLYSLYGDHALLFDSDTPDPALLAEATAAVLATGRPLYIASQHEPLPDPLVPPGYATTVEQQMVWQSSLIGQSPTPYPLPIWYFAHPLYLYRVTKNGVADEVPVQQIREETVASPDSTLQVNFQLISTATTTTKATTLAYGVSYHGATVLQPSALGLLFDEATPALGNLVLDQVTTTSHDESYVMPFGERSPLRDQYNEMRLQLREEEAPHRLIELIFRAYESGIALRYLLPAQPGWETAEVLAEATAFTFPADPIAYFQSGTEGLYEPTPLSALTGRSENPLTIVPVQDDRGASGPVVSITEAHVTDYPRMVLTRDETITATLHVALEGTAQIKLPFQTPWRVLLVADNPVALLNQNDLLYHLSPPSVITDTSWIQPGQAMRIGPLNTAAALEVIDFAAAHGIEYAEYDVGWYPNGYYAEFDPASDATKVAAEIDMPQVLAYANEKNIGVWLYVNDVAVQQQLDEILPLYVAWGVKGIKFGYVDGRTQEGINFLHEALAKASAHQLMIDIHDNYRPSGMSRTYPNLLTQEGVRGNEHFSGADYNTILPFTRMLAGAADHTFPYYFERVNVTRAHQLAAMIVIFSPLQFVLWYDSPVDYGGEAEIDLIGDLPTVWDETIVLDGTIGETITVARRSGSAWYVGTLTNSSARTRQIPLTFLPAGVSYQARFYHDETATAVAIDAGNVSSETTVTATMLPSGGHLMWLVPAE